MKTKYSDKILLQDSFQLPETNCWQINEAEENSKVDGKYVLARVEGPMGLADGVSLNNRRYSPKLWESTINKIQPKLNKGGIHGTIGHDQSLDEKALMERNLSHLLTKLWIKENTVMGEILVLGTQSGQQLNTCLRAGMPIPVSTRAYGKISGQGEMGEDIIDPESFILESVDFVLNPGVETAYPKVVENKQEEIKMDELQKSLNEKLELQSKLNEVAQEKLALQSKLNEAAADAIVTSRELTSLKSQNDKLRKAFEFYKAEFGIPKEVPALKEGLVKWFMFEPFVSLAKKVGLTTNLGMTVKDFGKQLGAVKPGVFAECASPETTKALKKLIAAHEEVGTVEEMGLALDLLQHYSESGSPEQVKTKLQRAKKIEAKLLEVRRKVAARKISESLNVNNAEVVYELLKKLPTKDVIAHLRKLTEAKPNDDIKVYKKTNEASKESKPALKIVKNESGLLVNRLMESFNHKVGNAS
jgi:Prohead core protein serine protease